MNMKLAMIKSKGLDCLNDKEFKWMIDEITRLEVYEQAYKCYEKAIKG